MIDQDGLDRLASRALEFAPGAGDSAFAAMLDFARAVLDERGPVTLRPPGDLPPDRLCCAITVVGSTMALGEQPPRGDEPLRAVRALENRLGKPIGAVAALNAAAENPLLAVITAAQCGVPLADGDGTGRVFPLLEQTTFAIGGVAPAPLAVASSLGDVALVDTAPHRVEDLVRPLVLAQGGWAVAACYPMSTEELAATLVPGTLSAMLDPAPPQREVRTLCRGRIAVVEHSARRHPRLPSRPASVVIHELGGLERLVRLEAHNEVVLALTDGAVAASVPDLICLLSVDDGMVVDIDAATAGMEVIVVVLPAAPAWHTEEGHRIGGLEAFGIAR
ncbi:DUF917 domain-containing protein [Amycolatopsis anabasis]|uniref:DUF917 domain-containing protein n=1 Tax=Amycolatopsis anabasis TaxID=1840409 RepID=UPI00131B2026|nr:DUF917 domain-containing protein [Amycolatopsis anabasis]